MFKNLSNFADAMYYVLQSLGSKYPSQADIDYRHSMISVFMTFILLDNLIL